MSVTPASIVPPQYERLYHTNVTFNTSIKMLAAMLPLWIDGMADYAKDVNDWEEEQMRVAMGEPAFSMIPSLPDSLKRGIHDPIVEV